MIKNILSYTIIALLFLTVAPQKADADIFGDALDWAKSAADSARKAAEKEYRNTAKSIKTVAVQTARQTVALANQAAEQLDKVVELLQGYLGTGNSYCKTALQVGVGKDSEASKATKELFRFFPKPPGFLPSSYGALTPKTEPVLKKLTNGSCRMAMAEGFTCAIFGELSGLLADIKNGKDTVKRLSQYIAEYSTSSPCNYSYIAGPQTGMTCAILRGLYEEAKPGLACSSKIFQHVLQEQASKVTNFTFSQDNADAICEYTGKKGFAYVYGAMIGKVSAKLGFGEDGIQDNLDIILGNLKGPNDRGLVAVDSINKYSSLCKKGAASAENKMERLNSSTLSYNERSAAKSQMVMSSGKGPKCLTRSSKDNKVVIWDCAGSPTQRWTYDLENKHIITDSRKNFCLYAPGPKGGSKGKQWFTYTCGLHNGWNKMELHEGGLIYNRHTNSCANVSGNYKKNGTKIISWPCENVPNEKWVVVDQNSDLVHANIGAHRLIYNNPENPRCLTMNRHGVTTMWPCNKKDTDMFWSIRPIKGKENHALIYDDRHGQCLSTPTKRNMIFFNYKCNGDKSQEFEFLPDGSIRNVRYNFCLNVRMASSEHNDVVSWPCVKQYTNDKWHWIPSK